MMPLRRRLLPLLSSVLLLCAGEVPAQLVQSDLLKALFLYNFVQYTQWPGAPAGELRLCNFSRGNLNSEIATLDGRRIGERTLRVVHRPPPEALGSCRLLFVAATDAATGSALLQLDHNAVLTVTDDDALYRAGAMILLVTEQRRMAFEINLDQARRRGLSFSSKMMQLSRNAGRGPP